MTRIRIRTLEHLDRAQVRQLVPGYESEDAFAVVADAAHPDVDLRLVRVRRPRRYLKRYPLSARAWAQYRGLVRQATSLGAYDGGRLVGLALVERRESERTLWIWEFGVAETHRRRGIGTALLRELTKRARAASYRVIGLETQTTNAPAIDFYRRNGFAVTRIDPTFYSRRLASRGEVAVFMEKEVPRRPRSRPRARRRRPRRPR